MNLTCPPRAPRPENKCSPLLSQPAVKAFIALAFHRLGLWLIYGLKFPVNVRRQNTVAVLLTVAVMGVTALLAPKDCKLLGVVVVWGISHLTWGLYLSVLVTRQ
jgi:hypothetical protein